MYSLFTPKVGSYLFDFRKILSSELKVNVLVLSLYRHKNGLEQRIINTPSPFLLTPLPLFLLLSRQLFEC